MEEMMKRWDDANGIMEEHEYGGYVKLSDHQSALDAVLKEAIWAMDAIQCAETVYNGGTSNAYKRARTFLASPAVRDYRARQEQP